MAARSSRRGGRRARTSTADHLLALAAAHLHAGQAEEALKVLKDAPRHVRRAPLFLMLRAMASIETLEPYQAIADVEQYLRLAPEDLEAEELLLQSYEMADLEAHLARALRRQLRRQEESLVDADRARAFLKGFERTMAVVAEGYGVRPQDMEQAVWHNERATLALYLGRYRQVIQEVDRAIRLVPRWPAPRNNRAMALFLSGRLREAITEEERVLQDLDPDNVLARANLVDFYLFLGERERATALAASLRAWEPEPDPVLLYRVIEALAYLEDDEALWRLAARALEDRKLARAMMPEPWYWLGTAAANTGHVREARRLLRRARKGLSRPEVVDRALEGLRQGRGPRLDGRFPYLLLRPVPPEVLKELVKLAEEEQAAAPSPQRRRRVERLVERYPQLVLFVEKALWDERRVKDALSLLRFLGTPEALVAIERFATGQYGRERDRLRAASYLVEAGAWQPGEKHPFWDADEQAWRWLMVEAPPPETVEHQPEIERLTEEAGRAFEAGDWAKAETALRQALELDPKDFMTIYSLAVACLEQERREEGERWLRRALELEPDHAPSRAALALVLVTQGRRVEGRHHLERLETEGGMDMPTAMAAYLAARVHLALADGRSTEAAGYLETLERVAPTYPLLEDLKARVEEARTAGSFAGLLEGKAQRSHDRLLTKPLSREATLRQCLHRLGREVLVGTARAWDVRTGGRKAELVDRLVAAITGEGALEARCRELSEEERQALRRVLRQGGFASWEAFVDRWGSDLDESPFWQWHEPKTVLGRLKMLGLVTVGTLEGGRRVVLVPEDLRTRLMRALLTSSPL